MYGFDNYTYHWIRPQTLNTRAPWAPKKKASLNLHSGKTAKTFFFFFFFNYLFWIVITRSAVVKKMWCLATNGKSEWFSHSRFGDIYKKKLIPRQKLKWRTLVCSQFKKTVGTVNLKFTRLSVAIWNSYRTLQLEPKFLVIFTLFINTHNANERLQFEREKGWSP